MGLSNFLSKISIYFDSRYKLPVHVVELCLVTIVIILSVVRAAMGMPQRAHIMGIAIGVKSSIFILYQLLTEHTQKFSRWASKKTNLILNCIDCPFWGAMMFLLFQANITRVCTGTSCVISWVMAALSIALFLLSHWVAFESYFEYKNQGRKTALDTSDSSAYEVMETGGNGNRPVGPRDPPRY
ncbi:uncharacterized protein GGS22DRAFT_186450 [Annulohypoxylon maeteangense]|uniref:uncharacterized protein n=1 Tax=Annulohypoxylon maeteangense TaxID=1927788 RepID=UPI002007F1F1|nr:uncharacterized protein GGS22DRAFT_186450 [Annulohypoxylon maeteangense]KAI0887616.1 hypothetical protein GGS22DRAFT_186450 [Annulohypoxylon maeteangense]